jgi:hypothetical protein
MPLPTHCAACRCLHTVLHAPMPRFAISPSLSHTTMSFVAKHCWQHPPRSDKGVNHVHSGPLLQVLRESGRVATAVVASIVCVTSV